MSRRATATLGVLAVLLGCTSVEVPEFPNEAVTTTEQPEGTAEEPVGPDEGDQESGSGEGDGLCLESLRPTGDELSSDFSPDSYMAGIEGREVLRVGVDEGTPQFSSIDPQTGEPVGFDVDLAKEVAHALFGEPEGDAADVVELVGMTTGERIGALLDGRVDMVVHNFTITCERKEQIAFSTEYYRAHQVILVPSDSQAEALEDLVGQRVCATDGSTVMEHIRQMPEPRPLPVAVPQRTDCLMLLQQGQVDALATDDAILAGLAAQDPNLVLGQQEFSTEPYGIGLPPGHPEWVRYVNAVLEDVREGRWGELYDDWLAGIPGLESDTDPPEPAYED